MNHGLKIGFLCSGNGGLFKEVNRAIKRKILSSNIVVSVMDRQCAAIGIAKEFCIPFKILERKKYDSREHFSSDLLSILRPFSVDLLVLTFDSLLTGQLLNEYSNRIINVHFSLLPAFRGLNAIENALKYGARFGGVTIHFVDESMDTGPIIMQASVPISIFDNRQTLGSKLFSHSVKMLIQVIRWFEQGRITQNKYGIPFVKNGNYEGKTFCPDLEIAELIDP